MNITIQYLESLPLLYEGQHTRLYYQESSAEYGGPVLMKLLQPESPTSQQIVQFTNEYSLTRDIDVSGIRKALDYGRIEHYHVIVLQYVRGRTLKEAFLDERRSLPDILRMAVEAARVLSVIHEHRIIHKDINCANILIDSESGRPAFIDFGIASQIALKTPHLGNPDTLEGTLAYISPEQTGRTNSVVDERTDLYSFGVTLYHILTGRLPFEAPDPLELVYCHIARRPTPLCDVDPFIPRIVSDIVMKLLEKNADDRYQSAYGVAADLKRCLEIAEQDPDGFQSMPVPPFELAQEDLSGRFKLPQKLYGRSTQIETLLATFQRVSEQGRAEALLVAGYSGVGKSALIQEVHRPMTEKRGIFIDGKFDQFQKNVPYYALSQAFDSFVTLLLTEPEEALAAWKSRILDAVGPNGQVLLDIIPRLALVIGEQPPVPDVEPQEARNRFTTTVQNFLRAACGADHPLVLFLDDLQWADSASLGLLQAVMSDSELQYLLLIAAYRDNEVDDAHPWMTTVAGWKKAQVPLQAMQIANLERQDINALLADVLSATPEETAPLAELLTEKTGGNAFFTHQFLQALHDDDLLRFDNSARRWSWELEQIQARAVSDNVIELMERKMRALEPDTQSVMTVAACIGNTFDLTLLAQACEFSQFETLNHLWQAVQENLIVPLDDRYKYIRIQQDAEAGAEERARFRFVHDRVQQSAYRLLNDAGLEALHLRVGRLLLVHILEDEREERIFEIAHQLNAGRALMTEHDERQHLAEIDLLAGRKAIASAAYEAALGFLEPAAEQMADTGWTTNAALTSDIEAALVQAEYMTTRYDAARQRIQRALPHLTEPVARGRFYQYQLYLYHQEQAYEEGIAALTEMLKEYGISLPKKITAAHVLLALFGIKRLLKQHRPLTRLRELPHVTDPALLTLFELLRAGTLLTALSNSPFFLPLTREALRLTLMHGLAKTSAGVLSVCSIIVSGAFDAFDDAYILAENGFELYLNFHHVDDMIVVNPQMAQWLKKPPQASLDSLRQIQLHSRDLGNLRTESLSREIFYQILIYLGQPLDEAVRLLGPLTHQLRQLNQKDMSEWCGIYMQQTRCMAGQTADMLNMQGPDTDESILLPQWKARNSQSHIAIYTISKMMLLALGDVHAECVKLAPSIRKLMSTVFKGWIGERHYLLWYSLSLCQLAHTETSSFLRRQRLRQVKKNQKRLKVFADYCPMNFQNIYDLIEAERKSLSGRQTDAIRLYERAIAHAREQGFVLEEALSNEYAAKFYLRQENETVAGLYMRQARDVYAKWGSPPKVALLEERYPKLLRRSSCNAAQAAPENIAATTTMTTGNVSSLLDVETIIKASQALAREVRLEKVLHSLMRLVVENAGAQQGCLFLKDGAEWRLQAQVHADGNIEVLQGIALASGQTAEHSSPVSGAIADYVLRTGDSIVLADARQDSRFGNDAYIRQHRSKSVLCQPVIYQGEQTGLLYLENNLIVDAFTPERQELLGVLSSQAAISLEISRHIENLAEQERLKREMELAQRIQTTLLPKDLKHPDFAIAAIMLPAEEVGGDYYDVLTGRDGSLWLAVGDVSGHGVTPGLVMMMAQTIHATLVKYHDYTPQQVINLLNNMLFGNVNERLNAEHFMTFTTLKYRGDGCFEYAGSHLALIVHRAATNVCERFDTTGCFLNLIPDIEHATRQSILTLEVGDTLVLYTDGLTEAHMPAGEILDIQRFLDIVQQHAAKSPEAMRDAVLNDVLAWSEQHREDDMTLVLVRRVA